MFEKEKKLIVKYGNKLIEKKLTVSTGGNISIYIRDRNIMLITPSSLEYDVMTVDDVIECTLEGKQLSAFNRKISSEWKMHASIYKERNDVNAMFHSHAVNCVAISTIGELPAIDYLVAFSGSYKVPRTQYASFGSDDIAKNSTSLLKNHYAALLRNHGINTIGKSISAAFMRLELLEFCANVYVKSCILGKPEIINKNEMLKMVKVFKEAAYGMSDD